MEAALSDTESNFSPKSTDDTHPVVSKEDAPVVSPDPSALTVNGVHNAGSEDSFGGKWSSDDRLSQACSSGQVDGSSTKSFPADSEDEGRFIIKETTDDLLQPEVIPITG